MGEEFKGNVTQANEHGTIRITVPRQEAKDAGLEDGQRGVFELVERLDE